jgi:hypothetical protein
MHHAFGTGATGYNMVEHDPVPDDNRCQRIHRPWSDVSAFVLLDIPHYGSRRFIEFRVSSEPHVYSIARFSRNK